MITKSQIKFIRSLHQKKNREKERLYIVEGIKMVKEALSLKDTGIKNLFYTPENLPLLKSELKSSNIDLFEVGPGDFQRMSILKNPQGILAVLEQPVSNHPEPTGLSDLVLILDSIRDPGNLGTIIRLSDWFGISHIFCSNDSVECYNPKVVQATMGAIFRVNILYTSLKELLQKLSRWGIIIYGSALNGENIYRKKLNIPAAVILGNETRGISPNLRPFIRESLLIPSFSHPLKWSESLNVSLAAAIICYEFRRKKDPNHSK